MVNTFDLQFHSTASDGKYAPAELAALASQAGLKTVALADHDTVDSIRNFTDACAPLGIEVIPAIELSAAHPPRNQSLHILGYGIDIANPPLLKKLSQLREERDKRAQEIIRRLQQAGFVITYEAVRARAKGGVIGRPHISYEVLENPANASRLGGVGTMPEFIQTFLVSGKPAYVDVRTLGSQEAVSLIRAAGGAAVWSHPAIHFPENFDGLEHTLNELIALGLDGLEVFSASHNEAAVKFLFPLSEKHHLLRTAGSDFHREPARDAPLEGGRTLGDFKTYGLPIDDILPKLRERILKRKNESVG